MERSQLTEQSILFVLRWVVDRIGFRMRLSVQGWKTVAGQLPTPLVYIGGIVLSLLLTLAPAARADDPPSVVRSASLQQRLQAALAAKGPDYQPRTGHLHPDGSPLYTNRLILEDSPYLLQHAHNPVDWHAWGPAAFARARTENKPIFLSIGYSTCHWCHVMERESFEDLEVARFLNEHFVAIKVDRERRPDIDTIYMTAVQLMTERGGWPMSSFLNPAGQTFFGGTYFPRAQFLDLLRRVEVAWRENRQGLEQQAGRVAAAVAAATRSADTAGKVDDDIVQRTVTNLQRVHDELRGGFGPAPKFPNEPRYLLLLDHALRSDDDDTRNLIRVDLEAMARGGIYDQVGGGFHRYSTDASWLVPHFEKMLYNQAQLARIYAEAWRLTGDDSFARIARQILDYVLRDMTAPKGGFYSATDADSAGGEGRFFLWTPAQIRGALSPTQADLAIELYGVTEDGNFEDANILHLPISLAEFATQRDMVLSDLLVRVTDIRATLYANRAPRVHPLRDEKIVTAWNGMMIVALAEVADVLHEPHYQMAALRAADSVWESSHRDNGELWRVRLDGRSSVPAIQEDYAWLADGFLHLYDTSRDPRWLKRAEVMVATMNRLFWDDKAGGYFMNTNAEGIATMTRPKDGTDGAVPSGNAAALHVLAKLAQRTGDEAYRRTAKALLAAYANSINQNPVAYSYLLRGAQLLANGAAGPRQYAARGAIRVNAQLQANTLVVDLAIRPGWHINAHKTLQEGLIPTVVGLEKAVTGWRPGALSYPRPVLKTLGFQSEELALYEGQVRITMDLKQTNPAVAVHLIPVELRLQACDDSVCLPPERPVLHVPTSRPPVAVFE
ncbi:MAG: DUF255 domain-containing protein [Gammaproteobacteria bacterium]|nr:DUF255 domain-containing protein [Gammaproteobacteria bacterium]